ncbi:SDR family oxidoreductase [Kaistella polysaccharea]|uniref:SDR family oxidoreductase n=1 Tax=Kaistella polysaccharea TaxID=2878534 RepID=UPI001CF574FB|nr:SDR family oxidoreductase [Kaistella polysaccharea]
MNSQNEVIVITGGAGGIGSACAKTFKNKKVIITDYSQELVDREVARLKGEGYNAVGIACDITDKNDVEKLVKFTSESGDFKALVHTAGVSGTVQDVKKIYTIDLVASEILVDAFYDLAAENSVAVLLSSMMGHDVPENIAYDLALQNPQDSGSFETVNQFVDGSSDLMYNFAKRGVLLLTQKNVNKWGEKGARIVSVSPGVIETAMALKAAEEHPEKMEMIKKATPLQRNGKPEDIADVVHFLVSDQARFITGTDILVDGGVMVNIKSKKS